MKVGSAFVSTVFRTKLTEMHISTAASLNFLTNMLSVSFSFNELKLYVHVCCFHVSKRFFISQF